MAQLILDGWGNAPHTPVLGVGEAHIWRVTLDHPAAAESMWPMLSSEERDRVNRFHFPAHGRRYAVAHGMLRWILALYADARPESLTFATGAHGKPDLTSDSRAFVHFNLSHSADMALVAVSGTGALGVDVEFWRKNVQHIEIAERFFSEREQRTLRDYEGDQLGLTRGFFAGWSRKEAYLKATGHGISRGLDHFDVSLDAGPAARLLGDRLDSGAVDRWVMADIDVGPQYSAAVVATAPLGAIRLYDAPYI